MGRRLLCVSGALLLAATLGLRAASGAAGGAAHPLFDDRGTLRWYTTFDDAARAARAEGRVIFMDMGRRACPPCQRLVTDVLPDARVRTRLARIAVGLAVDADRPDARANALRIRHLPGQTLLPMTAFLTPEGTWITGASGGLDVAGFLLHVERAEATQRRLQAQAPARPPQPAAPPRAAAAPPPPPAPTIRPGSLPPAGTNLAPRPAAPRVAVPPPPPPPLPPQPVRAQPVPPQPVEEPVLPAAPRVATGSLSAEPRISCCVEHNPAFLRPAVRAHERPPARAPERPTERAAERAAAAGRWGEVLRLTRASRDPQDQALARRALEWGETLLARALADALAGRTQAAVEGLERVRLELPGEALGEDAARGLDALGTLRDLAQLSDPRGPLASALRRNKHDELRGTRWARLFPAA